MPFINSEEERVSKPDPEIYIRACDRIGVTPDSTIYLDDGAPELHQETKALGMHYIYWPSPEAGLLDFR